MSNNEDGKLVSIDPPAHAHKIGVDGKCREHRFDRYGDRMFVEVRAEDSMWTVGPCYDLEQWVDEIEESIGWSTVRYSSDEPFKALGEQLLTVVDDD